MENKNLPENERDTVIPAAADMQNDSDFDEDIYLPENSDEELTDDELDISELLRKYLPDFTSDEQEESTDPAEIVAEFENHGEDDVDAPLEEYSEEIVPEADEENAEYEEAAEYSDDEYVTEMEPEVSSEDEYTEEELYEYEPEEAYDYAEEQSSEESYEFENTAEVETYSEDEYIGENSDAEDYSEYSYVSDDAPYEEEPVTPPEVKSADSDLNIPEDTGLDATDINLMVAFGLDDELAKTMGPDVAERLAEEIHAEALEHEEKVRRSVENEFLDSSQIPTITAEMKRKFGRLKVKLFFASLLTLLLLLYENLKIFGIQFSGALNPAVYPVIYIMGSLQLMLFCAAIGYEQLLGGCINMFRGKFGPSSLAFIGNVAAIVYSVIQAETTVLPNEPVLFNSCAASMTLFALVYDCFTMRRDMLSFNIVSAKRPKYAVRYMTAADAGIPGGLFEDDDVSEGGVLRIEKTKFVEDFFARSGDKTKSGKAYSAAYVFISIIIAVIMGVYTGLNGVEGGISPVNAAFVAFFATMPLSLFIAMGYPFYKGVSNAYDYDGTILGEASAEEYADAGAVCFNDIDAFPSYGVKVQNIKIYNNHRIDRVLYYAASAFKETGGPLSDVFEMATMEIGTSDDVEVQAAAEGYLGVKVDGKNIIFGSADALREYGINLPDSVTEEDDTLAAEVCSMYMLREGKLMAKLLVRYMLDSDFEFLLKDLSDEGMCACIKTFDPNIDDELVTMRLGGGRYPFRVLRYNNTDEINRVCERLSSGIISRGTTKPLLNIIGSCSKMLNVRKAGFTAGIVSSLLAAVIVWLLIVSGGFTSLSSIAVVIYHILWALPVIFTSKMFLK